MKSLDEIKAHQRVEREKRERWVCGSWSRQMNFKDISSRVERESPLGGVSRQAKRKALG
jgi:hypothetical protein